MATQRKLQIFGDSQNVSSALVDVDASNDNVNERQKRFSRLQEPGKRVVRDPTAQVSEDIRFGHLKTKPEDMVHADDVLKPQQRSRILQESIDAREQVYHSAKNPVGGRGLATSLSQLPKNVQDQPFGRKFVPDDATASSVIVPEDVPEDLDDDERSRRDFVTHGKPPVGKQKSYGVSFGEGVDPTSVVFGKPDHERVADNWAGIGVATVLGGEREEQLKVHMVHTRSAAHSAHSRPEVGKRSVKPQASEDKIDEDKVFGHGPRKTDDWGAYDIMTGGRKRLPKQGVFEPSLMRPDPSNDAAREPSKHLHAPRSGVNPTSTSKLPTDIHAEYATKDITHGLPSVIRVRNPRHKSVANMHTYGEEIHAKDLVLPATLSAPIESDPSFDPPMTEAEIVEAIQRLEIDLTPDEVHLVYEHTKQVEGKKGNDVTLERFRRYIFPVLYQRAGGLA